MEDRSRQQTEAPAGRPCLACGEPTRRLAPSLDLPICGGDCERKIIEETRRELEGKGISTATTTTEELIQCYQFRKRIEDLGQYHIGQDVVIGKYDGQEEHFILRGKIWPTAWSASCEGGWLVMISEKIFRPHDPEEEDRAKMGFMSTLNNWALLRV